MVHGMLVRLDSEKDLIEVLNAQCATDGIRAGWVRAVGTVEGVVLRVGGEVRELSTGVYTLVHFDGSIATDGGAVRVRAFATVSSSAGVEAGELVSARIVDVEAFVALSGSELERVQAPPAKAAAEPEVVRRAPAKPAAAQPTSPRAPVKKKAPARDVGFAAVARASASASSSPSWDSSPAKKRPTKKDAGFVIPREVLDAPNEELDLSAEEDAAANSPWAAVAAFSDTVGGSGGAPVEDEGGVTRAVEASRSKLAAFMDDDTDFVDVDELERGDILEHPILGECKVMRVIDDEAVQLRINNGPARKLMMRIFDMVRVSDHRYKLIKKSS